MSSNPEKKNFMTLKISDGTMSSEKVMRETKIGREDEKWKEEKEGEGREEGEQEEEEDMETCFKYICFLDKVSAVPTKYWRK